MTKAGDDWVSELQNKVIRDMRKVYSHRVMELWQNPPNAGSLDYPDGYGQVTGPCGDTMQIWLRVANNVITEATFWTDGCGTSVVCASMVTVMAKGKTLEQAARIDQQAVLDELGGLPEEDRHCALLAANTLREAIGCVRPKLKSLGAAWQSSGMTVAVASGKGGTGKTTVAVNLARVFGRPVQLFDCDVEEPNVHLFLKGTARGEDVVTIPVPVVDESRCDACGECSRFCQYHVLVSFGTRPLFFPEMCHGCGGCARVCTRKAISEQGHRIGLVETMQAGDITLFTGRLDVGVAMAPPLVRAVKARRQDGTAAILDAPPGTSCPVITTLRDADVVVLVTEPTPFGLNDLKLAVDMVRELGIPFGVVVNRVGVGDERVHTFCREQSIPILLEIPDDRRIAEAYSRGELVVEALPEYRDHFFRLWHNISAMKEMVHANL